MRVGVHVDDTDTDEKLIFSLSVKVNYVRKISNVKNLVMFMSKLLLTNPVQNDVKHSKAQKKLQTVSCKGASAVLQYCPLVEELLRLLSSLYYIRVMGTPKEYIHANKSMLTSIKNGAGAFIKRKEKQRFHHLCTILL